MSNGRRPPANDNSAATRKCPICGQAAQLRFQPFCSKRCSDVDLNRWLTGSYAIPVTEDDASSEGEPEGPSGQR
jgi:endogenous inhibitor of DNA gyrase (YacG/DUF329 family)